MAIPAKPIVSTPAAAAVAVQSARDWAARIHGNESTYGDDFDAATAAA